MSIRACDIEQLQSAAQQLADITQTVKRAVEGLAAQPDNSILQPCELPNFYRSPLGATFTRTIAGFDELAAYVDTIETLLIEQRMRIPPSKEE